MESASSADNTKLNNTAQRPQPTNAKTARNSAAIMSDARTPQSVGSVLTPTTPPKPMHASTVPAIQDANTNHQNAPTVAALTNPTPRTVKSSKPYATQRTLHKGRIKMKKCRQGVLKCQSE